MPILSNIHLQDFRTIRDIEITCSPLTIFTGENGTGKTSALQAIQSARDHVHSNKAEPDLLAVGDNSIRVGVLNHQFTYSNIDTTVDPKTLPIFSNEPGVFKYINYYVHVPILIDELNFHKNDMLKHPEFIQPDSSWNTVGLQAKYWFNSIFPYYKMGTNKYGSYVIQHVSTNPDTCVSHDPCIMHGFHYILQVIYTLLTAEANSLVIIENPEHYLHQSALSVFMNCVSLAVKSGIQVIIETQSDHIVFGALVNMKQGVIPKGSVSIQNFTLEKFGENAYDYETKVSSVAIGPDCRIKNCPDGFMEQTNLDLDVLYDE